MSPSRLAYTLAACEAFIATYINLQLLSFRTDMARPNSSRLQKLHSYHAYLFIHQRRRKSEAAWLEYIIIGDKIFSTIRDVTIYLTS